MSLRLFFQIPGVASLAVEHRFGCRRQIRRSRFAEDDEAGLFISGHCRAVEIGHRVFPDAAACRRSGAAEVLAQIFQGERHARERPGGESLFYLLLGLVKEDVAERIDFGLIASSRWQTRDQ